MGDWILVHKCTELFGIFCIFILRDSVYCIALNLLSKSLALKGSHLRTRKGMEVLILFGSWYMLFILVEFMLAYEHTKMRLTRKKKRQQKEL